MGFLEKALMIYLCIAIAIAFFNPSIVLSNNSNNTTSVLGLFDVGYNATTNEPYMRSYSGWRNDSEEGETLSRELNFTTTATAGTNVFKKAVDAVSSAFQWVIDGLANVMNLVKLVGKFIFSPFILFGHLAGIGAPTQIFFIFAIPLAFMFLLALIRFIRGGSD